MRSDQVTQGKTFQKLIQIITVNKKKTTKRHLVKAGEGMDYGVHICRAEDTFYSCRVCVIIIKKLLFSKTTIK